MGTGGGTTERETLGDGAGSPDPVSPPPEGRFHGAGPQPTSATAVTVIAAAVAQRRIIVPPGPRSKVYARARRLAA
ncbi:hypothetical protein GCM10017586_12310 [Microbacterium imperiale]|uniref:Uncharacterized protein n=1 Tax=Microbacterium imperiale TaxID=33884 RepID=A0A9W6HFE3_9MICO|nr:hypothetical protein GCM10017544_18620 [Microbacterium imperiale]GLJ79549.1 hypothetical protein GCM10017586_12310 [Microbacterium imperiale]